MTGTADVREEVALPAYRHAAGGRSIREPQLPPLVAELRRSCRDLRRTLIERSVVFLRQGKAHRQPRTSPVPPSDALTARQDRAARAAPAPTAALPDSFASKETDVRGHTGRHAAEAGFESDRLSGAAIAIRPSSRPGAQQSTGLSDLDRTVVADVIADCNGVIGWGGHAQRTKESRSRMDAPPGDAGLAGLARRVRGEDAGPGTGAGSVDPFLPNRRKKAATHL